MFVECSHENQDYLIQIPRYASLLDYSEQYEAIIIWSQDYELIFALVEITSFEELYH